MPPSQRLPVRPILTALFAVALGAVVLERLTYAGAWHGRFDGAEALRQAIYAVPSLLYCSALWALRSAATGPGWTALARAVRRAGVLLAAGALAALLLLPLLRDWVGAGNPKVLDLDIASLVLAGLGLGLATLARDFERAAEVQADLDGMF